MHACLFKECVSFVSQIDFMCSINRYDRYDNQHEISSFAILKHSTHFFSQLNVDLGARLNISRASRRNPSTVENVY